MFNPDNNYDLNEILENEFESENEADSILTSDDLELMDL
jgi:hypothetical protein